MWQLLVLALVIGGRHQRFLFSRVINTRNSDVFAPVSRIVGVFLFFFFRVLAEADFLHMRVRFAVPTPLLLFLFFRLVMRVAGVIVALMLRVAVMLLFLIGVTLFVVGFESLVFGLYGGVALGAVALSVCLKLFDGLDYLVSGLRPVRAYESLSEVLWHLPPQLVVEVVLFHRC